MRGLRAGNVRDEVYRHCPDTFDEAVRLALDAEFNFRQQKFDSNRNGSVRSFRAYQAPRYDGPTPMDISTIDVNHQRRFQNRNRSQRFNQRTGSTSNNHVRRDRSNDICHKCQQKGHWAPDCKAPRRTSSSNGRAQRPGADYHSKNSNVQ
jgi:hypothetical protein